MKIPDARGCLRLYFRVVHLSGIPGSYHSWSMPTRLCMKTQGRLRRCSGKFQPVKLPPRLDGSGNSPTATRSSQRWFPCSSALSSFRWCCSRLLFWAVSWLVWSQRWPSWLAVSLWWGYSAYRSSCPQLRWRSLLRSLPTWECALSPSRCAGPGSGPKAPPSSRLPLTGTCNNASASSCSAAPQTPSRVFCRRLPMARRKKHRPEIRITASHAKMTLLPKLDATGPWLTPRQGPRAPHTPGATAGRTMMSLGTRTHRVAPATTPLQKLPSGWRKTSSETSSPTTGTGIWSCTTQWPREASENTSPGHTQICRTDAWRFYRFCREA